MYTKTSLLFPKQYPFERIPKHVYQNFSTLFQKPYPCDQDSLGKHGAELVHGEKQAKCNGWHALGDHAHHGGIDPAHPRQKDAQATGQQGAEEGNVETDYVVPGGGTEGKGDG